MRKGVPKMATTTNYLLLAKEMNELFAKLEKKYAIYAPVRIHAGGRYAQQDSILYKEVHTYEEIEFHERSTYPAKKVLHQLQKHYFILQMMNLKKVN